jgi:type I restriction enzyme M protein
MSSGILSRGTVAAVPKVNQRSAYESLTKARLTELAADFELAVPSNHAKAEFIDALASSKRASFGKVLASLSRDELKQICRDHQLDASGREKQVLIARLLGHKAAPEPKSAKTQGEPNPVAKIPVQLELPTAAAPKLTIDEMEKHLWAAADILRGSIDSSDYKNFIFGLLFLKRLSDRFEEGAEKLIAEGEVRTVAWSDPDQHQFFVPPRARWSKLQKTSANIGTALNKACAALDEANPALEGVLLAIDYNDPNRLGDTKNRDAVLGRLIQHFSKVRLRNVDLSEPDMLGRAYEYLIEKFADDAGKKGGEFYTPNKVAQAIVEVLEPTAGMRICDPTCGSGGMLIQCAKYVERKGGDVRNLTLHGQEKNLGTWGICKMNMLLHGFLSARIEKGDTIRDPKLVDGGELMVYERVVANPPFSLDKWGREIAEGDRFGRFQFGLPPKGKGDLAFIQHMFTIMSANAKVGVVVPHGVLFRGAAEGAIRKGMLREDLFEAVIGLPSNLFYGTGIPAAILVLARKRANGRKGKVLFVDASNEFGQRQTQNYLRDEDVAKIAKAVHEFKDIEKYAKVVGLDEIERNEWSLNISRYIDTSAEEDAVDLSGAIAKLRWLEQERAHAEANMNRFLEELGYGRD